VVLDDFTINERVEWVILTGVLIFATDMWGVP
jgi:hypothetical protein